MKKKIFFAVVLTISVFAFVFAFGGCKEKPPESGNTEEKIEFSADSVELAIGENTVLQAVYEGDSSGNIAYSVQDPSIASVSEDGTLLANAVGETTVTASKGAVSDTLTVTVNTGSALPALYFENVRTSEELKISLTDTFDLSCYVMYNGTRYEDADITYTQSEELGSIENGIFSPAKTGTCTVRAVASWRNVGGKTMETQVTIGVYNDVELYVNDNLAGTDEIVLYTYPEVGGNTFVTETDFVPHAYENGAELPVEVKIVSGQDVVSYNEETHILSSEKYGTAVIGISCTDTENKLHEKFYTVSVKASVADYDGVIEFSAADGTLPLEELFGSADAVIVEAYDAEGTLTVENNRILGIETTSEKPTERTITVCTEEYGYNIRILPYTKIVTKAEDLAYFKITNDVDGMGNASNVSGNFDGYYLLGNDIDAAGYTHATGIDGIAAANKVFIYNNFVDCGLTGTFDGNGHTISNLSIGRGGLFGVINEGTVKNLGLSEIAFSSSDAAALAWYTYGGSIENVYIDVAELPNVWARAAVAGNVHSTTKVENLLVELGGAVSALNGGYGSFTSHDGTAANGDVTGNWNNIYIVSSAPCTVTSANKVIDGENTAASAKYAGIKRYESYDEMKLAGNDFASFETSGYWSMENGIPVFGV